MAGIGGIAGIAGIGGTAVGIVGRGAAVRDGPAGSAPGGGGLVELAGRTGRTGIGTDARSGGRVVGAPRRGGGSWLSR